MALRILAISSHDIDGPDSGATIRARAIFQLLARFGSVHVVQAGRSDSPANDASASRSGLGPCELLRLHQAPNNTLVQRWRHETDPRYLNTNLQQASPADQARMRALVADHDLVWIYGLRAANGFGLYRWPHAVLDVDDIPSSFHRTERLQAKPLRKLVLLRKEFLWRRREKLLRERFDALCITSEADRPLLPGLDRVFVVPNGFTPPERPLPRQPATPPRVGFVGQFGYEPNREGFRWFVEQVWPLIRHRWPEARLRVVGRGGDKLYPDGRDNIDGLGWVADVEPEMATWSLSVVPIFVGGGTRIKIAEALSRRCPIVATPLGAYGYELAPGREIALAETPEDFAARCLEILAHPAQAEAMAERGWETFRTNWTWEANAARIAKIIETVRS